MGQRSDGTATDAKLQEVEFCPVEKGVHQVFLELTPEGVFRGSSVPEAAKIPKVSIVKIANAGTAIDKCGSKQSNPVMTELPAEFD